MTNSYKSSKSFVYKLLIIFLCMLALCGAVVVVLDPFYHYHRPWFGLKPVLTEKEYQVPGTLRNFDYNALIVGSSTAENNNNSWYNEDFNCTAIKAIRSYGATADLCYLLDIAFESHDPDYIFYSIDISSLVQPAVPTYKTTGAPLYLYDHNILNDYKYLFNKDVLFKRIPAMIVKSQFTDYNDSLSYNWDTGKIFSESAMLSHYARSSTVSDMRPQDCYNDQVTANIALLEQQLDSHPNTRFMFFFPVYSIMYWDSLVRGGDLDAYLYNEELTIRSLISHDNAEVYFFQDNEEIAANLDNYMDILHFTPEINHFMEQQMAAGECRVTTDNLNSYMDSLRMLIQHIEQDIVPYYEDNDMFLYDVAY